jgi:hypothetical protein
MPEISLLLASSGRCNLECWGIKAVCICDGGVYALPSNFGDHLVDTITEAENVFIFKRPQIGLENTSDSSIK